MVTHDVLRPRQIRVLDLVPAPGSPPHLYAASGLVAAGEWLHVIADDEVHVASFAAHGVAPGMLSRLLCGELPDDPVARKAAKPDLEVLVRLPDSAQWPHGALLALGSGSRPQRRRGALAPLDERGGIAQAAITIDASPLYTQLMQHFEVLNLEGGWVHQGRLHLLQRGNRGHGLNALIIVDLAATAANLLRDACLAAANPDSVTIMDLGAVDGVRLGFTDGCGLPDGRWLFSAVAEDSGDAYQDGTFGDAVIGLASPQGEVIWQRRLEGAGKVEGIHARMKGGTLRLLCVTDADDRTVPARLLQVDAEA